MTRSRARLCGASDRAPCAPLRGARAASMIFSVMRFASRGFSSKYSARRSLTTCSTHVFTCDETSLSFVCDENFGSRILTEMTAVRPSRMSSPSSESLSFSSTPVSTTYLLTVRVSAPLKPTRCVPPSVFLIVFVKRVDVVGVAVVPLQRDLDLLAVLLVADEDRLVVQRGLVLVQVLARTRRCRLRSGTRDASRCARRGSRCGRRS